MRLGRAKPTGSKVNQIMSSSVTDNYVHWGAKCKVSDHFSHFQSIRAKDTTRGWWANRLTHSWLTMKNFGRQQQALFLLFSAYWGHVSQSLVCVCVCVCVCVISYQNKVWIVTSESVCVCVCVCVCVSVRLCVQDLVLFASRMKHKGVAWMVHCKKKRKKVNKQTSASTCCSESLSRLPSLFCERVCVCVCMKTHRRPFILIVRSENSSSFNW